jgi:hypothetical protein
MIEFAILALEHVGVAVFDAVVHIVGHESFASVKLRLHKRILRNHDVTRALRESFLATVGLMEKRYFASRRKPGDSGPTLLFDTGREAQIAFMRLRSDVDRLFPEMNSLTETDDDAVDIVTDPNALTRFTDVVLDRLGDAPQDVRRLIRQDFSGTFRFAFTEIGLKHNESVRSVITLDLLSSLTRFSVRSEMELQRLREAIQVGLTSLEKQEQHHTTQLEFHRKTTDALDNILDRVTTVGNLQKELIKISQRIADNLVPAPTHAYVLIADQEGNRLAQGHIHTLPVTIGRDSSNSISLPHRLVSRWHARVEIARGALVVEDLGTRNGTFLNGDQVLGQASACFGDQFRIGPFLIEFRRPEELLDAAPVETAPADEGRRE